MAKFYGIVGYIDTVETAPGVWRPQITEREYYGDFVRNTSKFQTAGKVNDDINVSNEISIVTDPYAELNFSLIRYVEFMGVKWKVNSVEVRRPRLILAIGGVYNSEQTDSAD